MSHSKKPGCLGAILQLFGSSSKDNEPKEEVLPYRLRDDFLSNAELSFYHVLQQAVGDWAVVCPKISLDDLFYAKSGQRNSNQTYTNKIDRKHVDFLLCHPQTMRPLLGIELDDSSHQKASRQERDRFVEKVFATAGLPLYRQAVHSTYPVRELANALKQAVTAKEKAAAPLTPDSARSKQPTTKDSPAASNGENFESTVPISVLASSEPPRCPQCGEEMVLRTAKKDGPNKGNKFWGCQDYPRCRGMRPLG